MRGNDGKNCLFGVRDVEVASSNLVTSTKKQPKASYFDLFSAVFLYIFHKIGCFQLTTCSPDFLAFYWIFHGFFSILLKIPFLCLLRTGFGSEQIKKRWTFLLTAFRLFTFHHFLKIPVRSLHFFFLITNQKREKPPSPATVTEPITMPTTPPALSPSLSE